jgi:signal transduction histidine kinase
MAEIVTTASLSAALPIPANLPAVYVAPAQPVGAAPRAAILLASTALALGAIIAAAALLPASRMLARALLGAPTELGPMLALTGATSLLSSMAQARAYAALPALAAVAMALVSPLAPWHVAVAQTLALGAIGGALLALAVGRIKFAEAIALPVLGVALIALLYDSDLAGTGGTGFAPGLGAAPSAAFALAAIVVLFARPSGGRLGAVFGEDAGSGAARWLAPVAIGAPLAFAWLHHWAHALIAFDGAAGIAFYAVAVTAAMLAAIWRVAATLNRLGRERRLARTALAMLNVELQRTAIELRGANAELEAFAYTVAHDLRAPLRAIDGFSRALLEDHTDKLEPEASRLLNVVRRNTVRMGALMDDLLAFSRLSRQPLRKQAVDPAAIVRRVLADGARQRQGRDIAIAVGELPVCQADPALLGQVFANLIDNAVKYTRHRDAARIEIGSRRERDRIVYYVADNGTGFDMAYASKLFGVFQRLHRLEDYDGAVWADAAPDRGATFFFTLG